MISNTELASKIFSQPQHYRQSLLDAKLVEGNFEQFSGKTFICVSLTRFCPVGCKFCFFKSGPVFKKTSHEDLLTAEGIEKFIEFSNKINLGYLLVSGGGEPMMEKKSILSIIEKVDSERIVLVTSAHWAKTLESATRYLVDIKKALSKRVNPTSLTIRVSVDTEHSSNLTINPIINLINLFEAEYARVPQLDLQIHGLDGDDAIDNLVELLNSEYKISRKNVTSERVSDGQNAIKIVPRQEIITFNDLEIKVGYAKTFYSNLKVDISNSELVKRNVAVYQKDLFESEDGNSAIVTNKLGVPGLDFWVNYNGNVTTWGNQYLDNLFNLYTDSAEQIIEGTLSDPAALAFIEKGAIYRDRVMSEANEIAVIRSKAVNIRDYTGALMFDEARTRLYFTIRVLQDYIAEGRITQQQLQTLSPELYAILYLDKDLLIEEYNNSSCTIVEETISKGFDRDYILDIFAWIKLGHYKLSPQKVTKLINYYNTNVNTEDRIADLNNLKHNLKLQTVRMTEHLTHIKPQALILSDNTGIQQERAIA